jgi:hypothetical protein
MLPRQIAFYVIGFMAAHFRRAGASFVKAAGFARAGAAGASQP